MESTKKTEDFPLILSIGKGIPSHCIAQMDIAGWLSELMDLQEEEAWNLERIYKNSAILQRHSVLPYILHPMNHSSQYIGMTERNALYKKEAPNLAEKSAKAALANWGQPISAITHVISVSCTGAITPGLEVLLARQLRLDSNTSLLGINFMGCFGAIKALKVAAKIAKENPEHRILLVCTELCSLHFQTKKDLESIVIQSLFSDGSAALVLGTKPRKGETPIFEIIDEKSILLADTLEDMSWDAADEGFSMTLSSRVPKLLGGHIENFVTDLIGQPSDSSYELAAHPGGKSILEAIENALRINRSQIQSSWDVLANYGNMSSATFLFVLDEIAGRRSANRKVIGLAFGPGLVIEGMLLHKTNGV